MGLFRGKLRSTAKRGEMRHDLTCVDRVRAIARPCCGAEAMSLKEMLTAALFKRDDAGRTIIYPNGATGAGYVVPDTATEQKLRKTLFWMIVAAGLFGGVGMQVLTTLYGDVPQWTAQAWGIAAAALAAFAIGYRALVRRLTRGMAPAEQRMGIVEAYKRQADAAPRWYLWFLVVMAPIMFLGSVIYMATGVWIMKYAIGPIGLALSALVMAQGLYGLRQRWQS
jgi:hypothetical protein